MPNEVLATIGARVSIAAAGSRYNTVMFLKNARNTHPIARPSRASYGVPIVSSKSDLYPP